MKLQLERNIVGEIDWVVDDHNKKGGRTILRIDLDDHEWNLFQKEAGRLLKEGILRVDHWKNDPSDYYYRGYEIVKR